MVRVVCYCARVLAVILLMTPLQTHSVAAMDAEKRGNIEALLRDTGMLANMNRMIDLLTPQIIGGLEKTNAEIPAAVWDEFTGICTEEMKRSLPELEEPVIAIYDANFSADEIKQLVAFYQSPVGRKIVVQLPQLMQQSVTMGQAWGQQAGGAPSSAFAHWQRRRVTTSKHSLSGQDKRVTYALTKSAVDQYNQAASSDYNWRVRAGFRLPCRRRAHSELAARLTSPTVEPLQAKCSRLTSKPVFPGRPLYR